MLFPASASCTVSLGKNSVWSLSVHTEQLRVTIEKGKAMFRLYLSLPFCQIWHQCYPHASSTEAEHTDLFTKVCVAKVDKDEPHLTVYCRLASLALHPQPKALLVFLNRIVAFWEAVWSKTGLNRLHNDFQVKFLRPVLLERLTQP
ncbi:hypothetical protein DV515_00005808 [Chloebia gouldiae]|uniref:Uncharacterized protein n=1 Tax=Chloebia gouldiae TaxID=44316 RepID=A0A3L8SM40_CHLGU|nr:hypothetical protein DV515_00005808 [Chloebia gouldiae]